MCTIIQNTMIHLLLAHPIYVYLCVCIFSYNEHKTVRILFSRQDIERKPTQRYPEPKVKRKKLKKINVYVYLVYYLIEARVDFSI